MSAKKGQKLEKVIQKLKGEKRIETSENVHATRLQSLVSLQERGELAK